MFARDGDAASNLYEMQCSWFENEAGDCHRRAGNVARSLKYYVSVTKHYDDMEEDQFDFHGYCMRKMTLRMYVDMLRAEDSLYDRPRFDARRRAPSRRTLGCTTNLSRRRRRRRRRRWRR